MLHKGFNQVLLINCFLCLYVEFELFPMVILKNYSLKPYNTFGLEVLATNLIRVRSGKALREALQLNLQPLFILGGGSNVLLTKKVDGLVLKNEIKGIKIKKESNKSVTIAVGGGENWHELVLWSVQKGFGGLENLSLIPGTVGAAPIQNIGAYGVELSSIFKKLEAIDLSTGKKQVFKKKDCQFGYRESIFKKALKGKYFITKVYLKLSKKNHQLNTSYGAIQDRLQTKGIQHPNIKDISDIVIAIRSEKLPDPATLGNSGSFFKNPEIPQEQFRTLQQAFPDIIHYDLPDNKVKIPAGWLIEQCGWKGKKVGNTGAYSKQALVLVNYGGATGEEVKNLAFQIMDSVKQKFGIALNPEVNII